MFDPLTMMVGTASVAILLSFLVLFMLPCLYVTTASADHKKEEAKALLAKGINSSQDSLQANSNIQQVKIKLSEDITAQVLVQFPKTTTTTTKPPLVFLHGSFHGAWCWTEHWFDYFVELGYPVVATNWRGTSGTPVNYNDDDDDNVASVKMAEHVHDLDAILTSNELQSIFANHDVSKPPVLVPHSFAGILVMKYLEYKFQKQANNDNNAIPQSFLSGIISVASVPPSGNGNTTSRIIERSWRDTWKVVRGIAMKKVITNIDLCRSLFYGHEIAVDIIQRYQSYFAMDSTVRIDTADMKMNLPQVENQGLAPFVNQLPPSLVLGAINDMLVDSEACLETAQYYGLHGFTMVDSPHAVMLGPKWKHGAEIIHTWLEQQGL